LASAATIEEAANFEHAREALLEDVGERGAAAEDGITVGQGDPGVGEGLGVEDVKRFENADEERDAGEGVVREGALFLLLFEGMEGTGGEAAEELAGVGVLELPKLGQTEEAFDGSGGEPPADLGAGEILRAVVGVSGDLGGEVWGYEGGRHGI